MQRGRVFLSPVTVGVALAVVLSGCSPNLPVAELFDRKTAQCNRLVEVGNSAVAQVQAVMNNSNPSDTAALTKIAQIADETAATMRSLDLQDPQLQQLRDRYVQMYADTSASTRALISANNQQNSVAAQQAYAALQAATSQEGTLVNEVNEYCRSGQ
ncbi:hypothetical protein H6F67_11335 [Microcoleus sp. FACHB-1515]|uniref:hypothetical protein n=1 Tax=Cyanophyceae TaxID=3028117 RepID=UPI0016882E8C|nr:hypothetical protein [Microcoleus sp. FACHB-1515]MBD2090448.1 hypothetical protein [Microcoleus sp. FACHB-1515]